MKKLIIIILLLFMCSACYNYREINDLAIVGAIGIEKDNNNFVVTTQVANIKKTESEGDSSNNAKIIVYKGKGKTIEDALNNITKKTSKSLFYSHMKILILDDDIIKNDLKNTIDFLARNIETDLNFNIITSTQNKPSEILEILTPTEPLPSNYLETLLKRNEKISGNILSVTFEDLLSSVLSYGKTPVLTNIKINGNIKDYNKTDNLNKTIPSTLLESNNLVAFKDNKIIKLNKEESFGYNILNNNANNLIITSKCKSEDNYFSLNLRNIKSKYTLVDKNNINIYVKATANIGEFNCNDSTYKNSAYVKITKKTLEKYINNTINLAKKNNTDFIGVGNYVYKNYPKKYNNEIWNKNFKKIKYNVFIKIKMIEEGNINKTLTGKDIYEKRKSK